MENLSNRAIEPKVEWSLTDEGMGFLQRTGLAGLCLTLTAADEWAGRSDPLGEDLKNTLKWELGDKSIRLWWQGDDLTALTKLLEWGWQIKDGVYYLPGIHRDTDLREHKFLRIQTHAGLLGTFLQFGGQLKPAVDVPTRLPVQFDADDPSKTVAISYRPIKPGEKIRQVGALNKICPLRNKHEDFRIITLPGWVYPGAAKRFGKNDEDWTGTTDRALLLFFAPIACFYMSLPRTKAKKRLRDNWAFLAPEITSLSGISRTYYDLQIKLQSRFDDVQASGLGDAGLRFAAAYAGRATQKGFPSPEIYVTAMGVVDYYSSNPTIVTRIRKHLLHLIPGVVSVSRYRKLMTHFPNVFMLRKPKDEEQATDDETQEAQATHWMRQPTARGRIADNLVNQAPWYQDLPWPPDWQIDELEQQRKNYQDNISSERLWFLNLQREWRALMNLANEESMYVSPDEHALVSIFHGALRRLLSREEDALGRGGSRDLFKRWDTRVEKIRRALLRSKTRELTRSFFTELLAEAGGAKELTEKKEYIWRLLNHPHDWKKARDLGFLCLVTFTDKRLGKKSERSEEVS